MYSGFKMLPCSIVLKQMLKANSKLNLGLMCNIIGSILIFLSDRELIFQLNKKKLFIFLFFRKTECLIVIDYIPL